MGRKDAERLLLVPGNQRGTFLVRESETTKGEPQSVQIVNSGVCECYSRVEHHGVCVIYIWFVYKKVCKLFFLQEPTLSPYVTGMIWRVTMWSTTKSASLITVATTSPQELSLRHCRNWSNTTQVRLYHTTPLQNSKHELNVCVLVCFFF